MKKVVAIYGSPRRTGNTALLLQEAVRGPGRRGQRSKKSFFET